MVRTTANDNALASRARLLRGENVCERDIAYVDARVSGFQRKFVIFSLNNALVHLSERAGELLNRCYYVSRGLRLGVSEKCARSKGRCVRP
jgi:hypothetical protein